MNSSRNASDRKRKAPRPLDKSRLEEIALAYVARFATSRSKLERYLHRKLRERGWQGEHEPDIAALADRYVEFGYVDDTAFAQAKSGSLLRRGYGPRRISQALGDAGIDEDVREEVRAHPSDERRAALALARRRRFGPFGPELPDKVQRERQMSAMLRAGHPLDSARKIVDAMSEAAAEDWAAELDEKD